MKLKSISYSEFAGQSQEWSVQGMTLGERNLLVGKNATGKTRILNVIAGLASHLKGATPAHSGSYDYQWETSDGIDYRYVLQYEDDEVRQEKLWVGGELKVTRAEDGKGQIFTDNIGDHGQFLDFQSPPQSIVVVSRRDKIQHPYLEPLHQWAQSFRFFRFGTNLGKDNIAIFGVTGQPIDENDQKQIVGIFHEALRTFGQAFHDSLVSDVKKAGYDVQEIFLGTPVSVRVAISPNPYPAEVYSLCVRETDLDGITDQHSMSQGMFRTFSLLIWMNYFQFKGTAGCIVVDDIGEGLDFDRSCKLIAVLREKSEASHIQLIMSTNDKNVMNGVPLTEWAVLNRKKGQVSVLNYQNSQEIFDDFRFTGLSNFSFFELDVANSPPQLEHGG